MDHKLVGFELAYRSIAEKNEWSALELDCYLRMTRSHTLAGAQIEWHTRPAPVINHYFYRDKSFRPGVRRNSGLRAVCRDVFPVNLTFSVLTANSAVQHIFRTERLDGMQNFCLLIMDGIGAEGDRRFQGSEREELKEMIGNHVAQRSRHVKVASAFFDTHSFSYGDLNMVNEAVVPDRFKDAIAEAKNQDVLYRLFSQIMINAEYLVFSQHFLDLMIQFFGRLQIVAKRFFKNQAAPVPVFLNGQFRGAKLFNNVAKESRAGGQIEEIVAVGVMVFVCLRQRLRKPLIRLRIGEPTGDVIQAAQHPVHQIIINLAGGERPELLPHKLAELIGAQLVLGNADYRELP